MFLFLLSFCSEHFSQFIVCVRIRVMLFFQTISVCDSQIIKDLHFNKQNKRESVRIFGYCNELILIRDFKTRLMTFFFDAMIWFMSKYKIDEIQSKSRWLSKIALPFQFPWKSQIDARNCLIFISTNTLKLLHTDICAPFSRPKKKIKENVSIFELTKICFACCAKSSAENVGRKFTVY